MVNVKILFNLDLHLFIYSHKRINYCSNVHQKSLNPRTMTYKTLKFRGMFWYSHKKIWSGTSMYVNLFGPFWLILATNTENPQAFAQGLD